MLKLLGLGPPITSSQKPETIVSTPAIAATSVPPECPPSVIVDTQEHQPLYLKPEQTDLLRDSLIRAGFRRYGDVFVHSKSAVTIELKGLCISVDAKGLSEGDVCEFLRNDIDSDSTMMDVGKHLLKAVNDMRIMSSTEADAEASDAVTATTVDPSDSGFFEQRCEEKLPTRSQLSQHIWPDGSCQIDGSRNLVIFTFGDKIMKKTAIRARGSQVTM